MLLSAVAATSLLPAQVAHVDPAPAVTPASTAPVPGDAARGQSVFESKGGCLAWHRVGDKGSLLGPDLSDVAARRDRAALEKSLLMPSPEASYKYYRVVTSDGRVVTGKLYNQDIYSVQMMDTQERLVSFQRSRLKEQNFVPAPPMPSWEGKLTADELTDVVAYLTSLKGAVKQ